MLQSCMIDSSSLQKWPVVKKLQIATNFNLPTSLFLRISVKWWEPMRGLFSAETQFLYFLLNMENISLEFILT